MSWGNLLNSATGANASAKTQFKYQKELQDDAQEFAKWQMGNSHQMEVADLEKAGLNKVLSAGGGGASAGVSASSVSAPSGGMDPLTLMSTALDAYSTIQQTKNNTAKTNADIENETRMTEANVTKALKEAGYTEKQIEYYNKHGVFPGATLTTSGNTSIGWGAASGGRSTTIPIGMKGTTHGSVSAKAFKNMSKEKWNSKSKAQKAMFPKQLRDLYNETYND